MSCYSAVMFSTSLLLFYM